MQSFGTKVRVASLKHEQAVRSCEVLLVAPPGSPQAVNRRTNISAAAAASGRHVARRAQPEQAALRGAARHSVARFRGWTMEARMDTRSAAKEMPKNSTTSRSVIS